MSATTALGSVSRSLRGLLLDEMTISPQVSITLLAPDEVAGDRRVNLFLYRVREHPQFRNAGHRPRPGASGTLAAPPLSLVLSYLMTAYTANDPLTGNAEAHAILGDAMRVLHQHPVVPGTSLEDDLDEAGEELRIAQVPLDTEEISRLWGLFDKRYRLSAGYEVSVVQLDQTAAADRPVPPRVRSVGVPDVRAPFTPPRISGIAPEAGPTGTRVTVRGAHLAGWRAGVAMAGAAVLSEEPLAGDAFAFTVPADTGPGFHRVRIDVSRLARATFFFEVT